MGFFCMVETLPSATNPQENAAFRYNILPAQPAADGQGSTEDIQARLLMPTSGSAQLFRQSHDLGLERRESLGGLPVGDRWPASRSASIERKASFGGTSPRPTFQHFQQLQRDIEGTQLVSGSSCCKRP